MRVALGLLLFSAACGHYTYNRAALVPRATPRMTTGAPMDGRGQLSVGASSVAHLGDPEIGDDANAGIEIPGTQLFGALKGRIGDMFSLGIFYESGLDAGAKKLHSSQPDVDNGNVNGYGMSLDISIPVDEKWHLGFGVDAMFWSCPYTSYETFTDGHITIHESGRDDVDSLAASVTPSYKLDKDITLFGGLTVRQHPTLDQKGQADGTFLDDIEVETGPTNYIVSGGVEGSLVNGAILLSAMAYYDISRDPAKYGPGMALMMSLPFGHRRSQQPPQQQPPPGVIYAPPGYGPPQPYPPQPVPPQPYPPQPYPPTAPTAPPPAPAPDPVPPPQ